MLIILPILFSHLPSSWLVHLPIQQGLLFWTEKWPLSDCKRVKAALRLSHSGRSLLQTPPASPGSRADPCCGLLRPPQDPGVMRMNTQQQVNRVLKCKAQLLFIDQTPAINLNSSYLTWKLNKRLNAPLKQVILKQQSVYTDVFKAYFRML